MLSDIFKRLPCLTRKPETETTEKNDVTERLAPSSQPVQTTDRQINKGDM